MLRITKAESTDSALSICAGAFFRKTDYPFFRFGLPFSVLDRADLDLAIANARFKTGLRMHGRAVDDMSIANGKTRSMPRTLDDVAVKFAF